MAHYGTIDPWSGHVFWIGEADSPEDACRKTDIEAGIYDRQFRYASACPPYANTSGFVVYELPGPAPEALRCFVSTGCTKSAKTSLGRPTPSVSSAALPP